MFSWALVFSNIILSHYIQADKKKPAEKPPQGFRPSVVSDTYLSEVRFAEVAKLNLSKPFVSLPFSPKCVSGKQPCNQSLTFFIFNAVF